MNKFFQRMFQSIFSRGYKQRLINISEILGLGIDFDDSDTDESVEEKFITRTASACGCTLQWRPDFDDFLENFREFATAEEIELVDAIPARTWTSNQEFVTVIKQRMLDIGNERMPILLESLGDFCHFLLVPKDKSASLEREAGGWLIET